MLLLNRILIIELRFRRIYHVLRVGTLILLNLLLRERIRRAFLQPCRRLQIRNACRGVIVDVTDTGLLLLVDRRNKFASIGVVWILCDALKLPNRLLICRQRGRRLSGGCCI